MTRQWFGLAALILAGIMLLSLSSCAHSQKLVSVQVVPGSATFQGVGAQIQFKAIGTYIHPPENKDITSQAQWSIDSQNLVTFNGPGNVTAINDCGTGNVLASVQEGGSYLFGTAFVSAAGVGTTTCTQAALTVVATSNGTVSSSPAGITCPGTCSAAFPLDSTVGLSATLGAGSTTVTWSWPTGQAGCASTTATMCTVVLIANQTITATVQ